MRAAISLSAGSSEACVDSAEANSRAAFSGCSRSWLAAAKNRVLLVLASSARRFAACCASSARLSSTVRSSTRLSSSSFDSRSASSVC